MVRKMNIQPERWSFTIILGLFHEIRDLIILTIHRPVPKTSLLYLSHPTLKQDKACGIGQGWQRIGGRQG